MWLFFVPDFFAIFVVLQQFFIQHFSTSLLPHPCTNRESTFSYLKLYLIKRVWIPDLTSMKVLDHHMNSWQLYKKKSKCLYPPQIHTQCFRPSFQWPSCSMPDLNPLLYSHKTLVFAASRTSRIYLLAYLKVCRCPNLELQILFLWMFNSSLNQSNLKFGARPPPFCKSRFWWILYLCALLSSLLD